MPDEPASYRGTIWRISGTGCTDFLERLLSQRLADLPVDVARPGFLLEVTGRIVGGGWWLRRDETTWWLVGVADAVRATVAGLERYRLREPIEILPEALVPTLQLVRELPVDEPLRLDAARRLPTGFPGLVWSLAGDPPTPSVELDRWRVERGIPWFGHELTGERIPLELGLETWLAEGKGCYVGQEVIERMWSRGRRGRRLARFVAPTATEVPPEPPRPLQATGARGTLTTIAARPEGGWLALGIVPERANLPEIWRDDAGRPWRLVPDEE